MSAAGVIKAVDVFEYGKLNSATARRDIFDYIEMFCNPKRKRARNGMVSAVGFENRRQNVKQQGAWETGGYSVPANGDHKE